ncbi:hypothetical protein EDD22DRAFT_942869 [Suillus occidentalis]|nr:hypothetical protein EDD22DRAFT_942869 [Suillus occidentalis]
MSPLSHVKWGVFTPPLALFWPFSLLDCPVLLISPPTNLTYWGSEHLSFWMRGGTCVGLCRFGLFVHNNQLARY